MIWEKLSRPWQICVEQAWEAYRAGSTPIGAVVTDSDGNVLSVGRNRIYENSSPINEHLFGMPLAHAEMNAFLSMDYSGEFDPQSAILYTTSEPCPLCMGGFFMAGFGELRYASRDPWYGSVQNLQGNPLHRLKEARVVGPQDPDFEHLIIAWLIEYKLRIKDAGLKHVLETWKSVFPVAYEAGKRMFQQGVLQAFRQENVSAQEFLDQFEGILTSM